ncbi:hypothetical protein ACOME3_004313 [Neoechinorhynchus agilis]
MSIIIKMDILKEELARKRKQAADLSGSKKYFKRSELHEREYQEYLKRISEKVAKKSREKDLLSEHFRDSQRSTRVEDDLSTIPPMADIVRRLRVRMEPIRLFGESDRDVWKRLQAMELREPEMRGQRNDFRAALDKVEEKFLNELYHEDTSKDASGTESKKTRKRVEVIDLSMTLKEIAQVIVAKKERTSLDSNVVLAYFKYLVHEWGIRKC